LFRSFIKKLNYALFKKHSGLKYVCVVERQERGALHYHIVLFNMPFMPVDDLAKIWGHGFVRINAIDDVDNLGAYVVKYIEKTMNEMQEKKSAKVKDKKLYFASRGLHKPVEISDGTNAGKEEILNIAEKVKGHEVFRKTYESEYYETFEVIQYNLAREKS
uniref:rolling circle replication-associated protein n=1 Tax=Kurthia senegalensis TaxID=1033740 RepID=UPI003F689A82